MDRVDDEFVHELFPVSVVVVAVAGGVVVVAVEVVENVEPSLVVKAHSPLFSNHNNLSTARLQPDCFSVDTLAWNSLVHDTTFDWKVD